MVENSAQILKNTEEISSNAEKIKQLEEKIGQQSETITISLSITGNFTSSHPKLASEV